MARTLAVEIVGDARSLKRAVGDADSSSGKLGGTFKKLGKAGVLAGGAAGVGALIYTVKTGIGEFMEAQKVTAQTNAVIKSTGGIANVTAEGVSKLSESIMKKTGIDDEQISSSQNMLLTFTNIRNELGKDNDIFNQATRVVQDMSVALGQDGKRSAMQLGKALNDPAEGMTKLQRIGVTFTKTQIDAAKEMQRMGDTAGAQRIILAELNKEFGGSAEAAGKTFGGQINILRERFNNWTGEMVAKTIPVLQRFHAWFQENWPTMREAIERFWAKAEPILRDLAAIVVDVVQLIHQHWGTIGPVLSTVANQVGTAIGIIVSALKVVTALLRGDWAAAWKGLKAMVQGALDLVKGAVEMWKTIIVAVLTGIGTAMKAGLVAGLQGIGGAAMGVINNIKAAIDSAIETIKGWGRSVGNAIEAGVVAAITGIGNAIWGKLGEAWESVKAHAKQIGSWGKAIGGWIVGGILSMFEDLPGAIWDKIKGIAGVIGDKMRENRPKVTPTPSHTTAPATSALGVQKGLWDEIGVGNQMGLTMSSGLRTNDPGSDHYYGKAIDMVGSFASMARYAYAMFGRPGVKDVIYGEIGSWQDNGSRVSGWAGNEALRASHAGSKAHVHVSIFDKGWGTLGKGWNLVGNFTGAPEPLVSPALAGGSRQIVVPLVIGDRELARLLIDPLREEARLLGKRGGVFA